MGKYETHFPTEKRGSVRSTISVKLMFHPGRILGCFCVRDFIQGAERLAPQSFSKTVNLLAEEVTGPRAVQLQAWLHSDSGVLMSLSHLLCLRWLWSQGHAQPLVAPFQHHGHSLATPVERKCILPCIACGRPGLHLTASSWPGLAYLFLWKPESVPYAPQ